MCGRRPVGQESAAKSAAFLHIGRRIPHQPDVQQGPRRTRSATAPAVGRQSGLRRPARVVRRGHRRISPSRPTVSNRSPAYLTPFRKVGSIRLVGRQPNRLGCHGGDVGREKSR